MTDHGVRSEQVTQTLWWPTCDSCGKVVEDHGPCATATAAREVQDRARAAEGVFQCDDCWVEPDWTAGE